MSAFASGVLNYQEITQEKTPFGPDAEAERFVRTMAELGDKLGPPLLQLPPSFDVGGVGVLEDHSPSTLVWFLEIRRSRP